jgi:hypothetical protein
MDNKNNKEPSVITITLNKAIIIVATSILVSAGGAIWATLAVANTIPFRVSAIENQLVEIRKTVDENNDKFMPLDLSQEKWKNNEATHLTIEKKLDAIEAKVDRLLAR